MGWYIALAVCIIILIVLCRDYQNVPNNKEPIGDDMAKFKNVQKRKTGTDSRLNKKTSKVLKWFVVQNAQDKISEAEKIIANELNKYSIEWYREIAFDTLKTEKGGYARYDFLLITPKGIHIIEYDGKRSHSSALQKERDLLKDRFCKSNGIPLTRYNSKHYYHLSTEISSLMSQYNIRLRF